jgi:hypothetical protein
MVQTQNDVGTDSKSSAMRPFDETAWRGRVWPPLLVAASAVLTTVFTCITPFAAFAVVAATSLSRWSAVWLSVVVWLANQAVGYGVLHYPWTGRSAAWGVAIGGAAVVATLAAHWTVGRLGAFRPSLRALGAFVSAFVLYQLTLYAVAVSSLGGTTAFVPAIVGQVLLVNAVTLVGLHGLGGLLAFTRSWTLRRRSEVSRARVASR